MKTLVIAESEQAARELSVGTRAMADEIVLVTFGNPIPGIADACIDISLPDDAIIEDAYLTLGDVIDAEQPDAVFIEPSSQLLGLGGRIAALAGTAAITGITELEDGAAQTNYFGGTGTRTVIPLSKPVIYMAGLGSLPSGGTAEGTDEVRSAEFRRPERSAVKKGAQALKTETSSLPEAEVVVAVGRGFSQEEQLGLARDLCSAIGAELGCTRPIAETSNWLPRSSYIGVSGLMLSPHVYIGAGVSGQMQHMVGCNRADMVFAINKDKNAPIFKQCDYGIVGNIEEVLPALTEALS